MAIMRIEKNQNYTTMSNYHLQDTRLTLKAIGLLSKILSLPDDWDYTVAGLASICKEGKDAVRSALEELEAAGYIERRQTHAADGSFAGNEYIVYEFPAEVRSPLSGFPSTDKPSTENPLTENPTEQNTNKQNTEESNTKESNKEDEEEALPPILRPYKEALEEIPEVANNRDTLIQPIAEFATMRKKMKKPIPTPHALALLLKKTAEMAERDPETMKAILDQSTMNGWSGVYELKEPKPQMIQSSRQNPFAALLQEA